MDKILFWIGANYTHFCIAKFFQKKTDYEIFGIFDVTNKPRKFFQTQKIVDFKKILFYHDAIDEVDKKPDLKFLEEFEMDIPMLMDYDGKVGKMYGAKTTPHMFVIDANGILAYHGALSNDVRFTRGDEATIYVMEAVEQLEAGKDVSPEYVKPWGCPVKYARDKPKGLKPVGRRPKF